MATRSDFVSDAVCSVAMASLTLSGESYEPGIQYATGYLVSIPREIAAFKARLKRALDAAGMSQVQLATALGGSQQAVSPWLDQSRQDIPKGRLMLALPGALGVSGHWLLTGEGPMTPPSSAEGDLFLAGMEEGRREAARRVAEALQAPYVSTAGGPPATPASGKDEIPAVLAAIAQHEARKAGKPVEPQKPEKPEGGKRRRNKPPQAG